MSLPGRPKDEYRSAQREGNPASLLVKGRREGRDIVSVTPQSAGWNYVGFAAHRLQPGEQFTFATGTNEVCLVVLRGVVSVAAQGQRWQPPVPLGLIWLPTPQWTVTWLSALKMRLQSAAIPTATRSR